MSHRDKGEHKSRHRTHAIKPASLITAPLAPLPPQVSEPFPRAAVIKSPHEPVVKDVTS